MELAPYETEKPLAVVSDGHGGNVGMRELMVHAGEYDVNILEVAASDATAEEIYERESMWKTKLGTRAVGQGGRRHAKPGGTARAAPPRADRAGR
jgi:hypothetical protein